MTIVKPRIVEDLRAVPDKVCEGCVGPPLDRVLDGIERLGVLYKLIVIRELSFGQQVVKSFGYVTAPKLNFSSKNNQ